MLIIQLMLILEYKTWEIKTLLFLTDILFISFNHILTIAWMHIAQCR